LTPPLKAKSVYKKQLNFNNYKTRQPNLISLPGFSLAVVEQHSFKQTLLQFKLKVTLKVELNGLNK
jgi:uncharacterized protein (DUF3820 family)